ncbi:hypothetical protein LTR37_020402 [Vermiconidia calcicola]|uniref:Uncharacterized protein n=1 Tax=Vermiconidia calcicola TaxID=1690605 RepID=A0ACC3MD74_9PEZI|nr:hypothetical protein LTR37_020402 [Vermiconidia calcicola]
MARIQKFSSSEGDIDLRAAKRILHDYNLFQSFANGGRHENAVDQISEQMCDVQKTVNEIDNIIILAAQKLRTKCQKLQQQTDTFIDQVITRPDGYRGGDLLSLTSTQLGEFLDRTTISDKQAFVEYVRRVFRLQCGDSSSPADEKRLHDFGPWLEVEDLDSSDPFLRKAFMLVQKMVDLDLVPEVLHSLVVLKTVYYPRNPRLVTRLPNQSHDLIDETLYSLIDGKKIGPLRLPYTSKIAHQSSVCWDFASAARTLKAAYRSSHCPPEDQNDKCFHWNSVTLLGWLQQKAWSSIRSNVFQCVAGRLPAELAETVFDYTLKAESIPANPATRKGNSHAARVYYGPVKRRYLCRAMKVSESSDDEFYVSSGPGQSREDLESDTSSNADADNGS